MTIHTLGSRNAEGRIRANTISGTRMNTIPPIVGVPFFTLCEASPSSRSVWPNLILCKKRMTPGMTSRVTTSVIRKAEMYSSCMVIHPPQFQQAQQDLCIIERNALS